MSDLHLSAQCMQHWCEVMQCLHTKLLKRLLKKTNNNNKTYIHTYIMEMSPPLLSLSNLNCTIMAKMLITVAWFYTGIVNI